MSKYRIEVVVWEIDQEEEAKDVVAEQELAEDFNTIKEVAQWVDDRLRTWNFPESVKACFEAVQRELS